MALNNKQQQAMQMLIESQGFEVKPMSKTEICNTLDIDRMKLWRWEQSTEWKQEYNKIMNGMLSQLKYPLIKSMQMSLSKGMPATQKMLMDRMYKIDAEQTFDGEVNPNNLLEDIDNRLTEYQEIKKQRAAKLKQREEERKNRKAKRK